MGKRLHKNAAEKATRAQAKRRRQRIAAFIWCTLECALISGYTNGWVWIKEALLEQNYYMDECNATMEYQTGLEVGFNHGDSARIFGMNGIDKEIENSIRKIHTSKKVKCVYRKVLKKFTVDEYKQLHNERVKYDNNTNKLSVTNCAEQNVKLQTIHVIAMLLKNVLIFPLWLIMDSYGTSRTRIIAMCGTAVGSLTMLFSSEFYPWLIFPALLTLGLSGSLVLLTDLQVANLFGGRRYTVMSVLVGAYFSGGIVIFFMKLTKATGVSLQTSFMFTTIGIVPVLISTIAMLPKSRIPWPLPAAYGRNKSASNIDKKAWQRRVSVGPKKKINMAYFWTAIKSKLYFPCVLWFSLLSLKIRLFDITLETRLQQTHTSTEVTQFMSWYAVVLLLSLPMSPVIGVVMDWNRQNVSTQPHVMQMKNIFNAMCLQLIIAIGSSVTSYFPNIYVQVFSFIFITLEKVSLHAVLFAFLMHVHFPSEHFGKLAGIVISMSGITLILQFPLKLLTQHAINEDEIYIYIIPVVLVLVSGVHPVCVWYHCRTGHINDHVENANERDRTLTVVLMEPTTTKPSVGEENTRESSKCTETTKLQITDL